MTTDNAAYCQTAKILIVDDDAYVRRGLQEILEFDGYATVQASDGKAALDVLAHEPVDLVLLDLEMPRVRGMDVLQRAVADYPEIPFVIVSGKGTIRIAVEVTKLGAYDFLEKPVDAQRVLLTVRNALEKASLKRQRDRLLEEARERYKMIGSALPMQEVYRLIDKASAVQSKVLITGKSGTGKELVARAIHHNSVRAAGPFVAVNCAAIPEELIESELFGIEAKVATGVAARRGKFEQAGGGTLFLDEIGDMSLMTQAKVLRALEERHVERIGSEKSRPMDVRVIAATNKDLEAEIEEGNFREDLYYRLNIITIYLTPLRERREDIPDLVRHFLAYFCAQNGLPAKTLDRTALTVLLNHDWPGNVRELRNVIERLVVLSEDETIRAREVQQAIRKHGPANQEKIHTDLREARDQFERTYILKTLITHDWKIQETADTLGIDRSHLWKKMKRYGVEEPG